MSLQSALLNASGALDAFSRVLDVTQNNVANASTPGYARQTQTLSSMPFGPAVGGMGGVRAGEIQSARNQFSEQAVRRETTYLGWVRQQANSLTSVQSAFDISEDSGIAGALNGLYSSFSAWGAAPNNANVRQNVVDAAAKVADAFHQTYQELAGARDDVETQLRATVVTVNRLTAEIAANNRKISTSGGHDAGLDAQINADLETLSQYAGITAMKQPDGSVNVLLDGQIPLVLGGEQHDLSFSLDPSQTAPARIFSGSADVTAHAGAGQLGALLDLRSHVLPSIIGDAFQTGDLNTLAQQFAARANTLMGPVPLFTYDDATPAGAARTLSVAAGATAAGLLNATSGSPVLLSGLAGEKQDALGGATFTEYYGQVASRIGSDLKTATANAQNADSALAQAKSLRQQMSGVSIDEEAMVIVEFQRAYEANSKLITILDQLTQDAINMLRS